MQPYKKDTAKNVNDTKINSQNVSKMYSWVLYKGSEQWANGKKPKCKKKEKQFLIFEMLVNKNTQDLSASKSKLAAPNDKNGAAQFEVC